MVNHNIKNALKRVGITQRKIKRRDYNRTYYETTKQERQKRYAIMKTGSQSETSSTNIQSGTRSIVASGIETLNDHQQFYETINDPTESNEENFEETFSAGYNSIDNQHNEIDFNELNVFCYESDESSINEFDDSIDGEDTGGSFDRTVDEEKVKFRQYSKTDVATCLCLLKKRHKCSNALLMDVIALLYIIIPNAEEKIPKSIFEIRRLLKIINSKKQMTPSTLSSSPSSTITICQLCETIAESDDKCSNVQCSARAGFQMKPYIYTYFNIRRQLEQIIQREPKMNFQTSSSSPLPSSSTTTSSSSSVLRDTKDGRIYQNFISRIDIPDCHYITLTLSTDGVQIGTSTEKSLWIITLTINEIQLSERFLLHNVIIGGINSCFKKPSREIMTIMIQPIVEELKQLQNPKCSYIKAFDGKFEMYCAHLLGSTNDKPATALLQNIAEPTAAYGCSRCEIKGITTLSNPLISEKKAAKSNANSNQRKTCKETHRIRVFVTEKGQPKSKLRSSERYETIMKLLQSQKPTPGTDEEQDMQRGYLGPCLLSDLDFFGHGQSFLSDSLHTLYGGAMKKLLALWFEPKWRTKEKLWTIQSKIPNLNIILKSFNSPSTTVRIPRNLHLYNKYKASEYRSILLIFYPIFEDFLPKTYYDHLKLLAFSMHIGENREIEQQDLKTMDVLLIEHVQQFHVLYGERHCVNNVHSIVHFSDTVRDYGPLQCYSTFNYESILGTITSTVHGCDQQDKEIFNNLEMLRQASFVALNESQDSLLYDYMLKLIRKKYRKPCSSGEYKVTKRIELKQDEKENLEVIFSTKNIQAFYCCKYEGLQYSSYHWKQSKHDAAILFHKRNITKLKFGVIDKFIVFNETQQQLFVQVFELEDEYHDYLTINGFKVKNLNSAIGRINFKSTIQILPRQIVEKVFCFHRKEQFMFIRLPNQSESS